MLIRCDEAFLNPNYLLESLYSEDMRIRFDRMVGGTTNPHLNVADVRELLVKQPKTKEQIRITNVLAEIRSSLSATQDQRSKLQLTKTGLMQDLLTGKVRVTELLKDAAAASP
jgi:type I restriction enzyme S subunit